LMMRCSGAYALLMRAASSRSRTCMHAAADEHNIMCIAPSGATAKHYCLKGATTTSSIGGM
jgi:hypothetical protein